MCPYLGKQANESIVWLCEAAGSPEDGVQLNSCLLYLGILDNRGVAVAGAKVTVRMQNAHDHNN